jgi:hypothetical protein
VKGAGRGLLRPALVGIRDHPPLEPGVVGHECCLPAEYACRPPDG